MLVIEFIINGQEVDGVVRTSNVAFRCLFHLILGLLFKVKPKYVLL